MHDSSSDGPRVPIGTVGELKVLNYGVPGVDLESAEEHAQISVPLETAQEFARRILTSGGASDDQASAILAHQPGGPSGEGQQLTNLRAVLRIEMLLGVLIQSTPEVRTKWYSQENGLLDDRTPLRYMADHGPQRLEQLLAGWVYG